MGFDFDDSDAKSDCLEALAHERRRKVLDVLAHRNARMNLIDLAKVIVEETDEMTRFDTENVYISLFHRHIPHLEAAGLVDLNEEQDQYTVTLTASGYEDWS